MKSSALVASVALLALAVPCSAQGIAPAADDMKLAGWRQPPPPPVAQDPGTPPSLGPVPMDPRSVEVTRPELAPPCPPAIVLEEPMLVGNPVTPPPCPGVWVDMDGVLWWLKPNHINAPLVTTTRVPEDLASTITAGGLSDPNTVVLFGQQNFRTDPQVGGRVRLGGAFDAQGMEVIEATGFWLPFQVERFSRQSDANGNPPLALAFNQVFPQPPVETASIVSGQFDGIIRNGNVLITNGTEMYGGELNYIKTFSSCWCGDFAAIFGVRYLYLEDYLSIDAATDVADGGGSTHDRFDVKNNFYGGQLGVRWLLDCDNWRFQTDVKLALGDTTEQLDISGSSGLPAFAAASTLPGGLYTASSNIGKSTTNRFGFVNEVDFNVAYKVSECVQLTAGYTYLYWDNVYRSGNQLDRNINPALNPAFSTITPHGGPAVPARLNAESSFWAQGVNLGVRFAF